MPETFQIVFSGRLRPSVDAREAIREFAAVFKVPDEQARALITEGSARVLKHDIDEANARRYQEILEEIGLEVRIEPIGDAAPGHRSEIESEAPRQTGAKPRSEQDAAASESAPAWRSSDPSPGTEQRDRDPYATPKADLTPPSPTASEHMTGPLAVPAGNGWLWIKRAWSQFRQAPWAWLGALVLVYLITVVLSLVPFIGSLASVVLGPIFAGGLMLGARNQERSGTLSAGTAFEGFSHNGLQLALVGIFYFLAVLLIVVAAGLLAMAAGMVSASSLEALSSNDPEVLATAVGPGLLLLLLFVLLFTIPLVMVYWFAPALVALDGMSALDAMLASLRGCWVNILPFLVYGVAMFLIVLGFSLVFGLVAGVLAALAPPLMVVVALLVVPLMLVFAAVVMLSMYTGYRDIFYGAGDRVSAAF